MKKRKKKKRKNNSDKTVEETLFNTYRDFA